MRLFLVRHGEAVGNTQNLIQGWADYPLTERGLEQAWRTAQALTPYRLRVVYSSSLNRALDTAQTIAAATGARLVASDALREVHCGQAEGLALEEFRARWPDVVRSFEDDDLDLPWPMGESTRQMVGRIWPAMSDILALHGASEDAVAVVSHGGPLAWAVSLLQGEQYDVWPPYRLDNCSITEFSVEAKGLATLVRLNDCSHLRECE